MFVSLRLLRWAASTLLFPWSLLLLSLFVHLPGLGQD
jgi:hypothetical protein